MAKVAYGQGVPPGDVIIETSAITIPDNVKRTIDLWQSTNEHPHMLIYISSSFVLRRAGMEWYKYTPWNVQLIPVAAESSLPDYRRDGWYKNENGIALVLNEYAKIIIETKVDYLKLNMNAS